MADFPTAKTNAVDNVTDVLAKHINNLENKVGIDSSTDTSSLDYKVHTLQSALPSGAIVGTTDTQELSGKTLKSPLFKGNWDGYIAIDATCTYVTSTTFTIPGDYTGILQKGDKIKLTQTSVKYFYVIEVSYSSPNTTVTVTGGSDYSLANATITSPYFSKIENPQGFPQRFSYTPVLSAGSGSLTTASASGTFSISGKKAFVIVSISITTKGTATGVLYFTIPVNNIDSAVIWAGRENASTGKMLQTIYNALDKMAVLDYTNNSIIGDGYIIRTSGFYPI